MPIIASDTFLLSTGTLSCTSAIPAELKYFPVNRFYEFLIPVVIIAGIIGLAIARPADKNKTGKYLSEYNGR